MFRIVWRVQDDLVVVLCRQFFYDHGILAVETRRGPQIYTPEGHLDVRTYEPKAKPNAS